MTETLSISLGGLLVVVVIMTVVGFLVLRLRKSSKTPLSNALQNTENVVPGSVSDPTRGWSFPAAPTANKRIFLSYRRDDSADVAGRIYDRLMQAFQKAQVYKDVDSIPLGVDFRKHLQRTVESCDVLLVVVGDRWLTAGDTSGGRRIDDPKDFVRIELEVALQRDIPVIPLLVRGATVPVETELPPVLASLSYRNGISIRPDPDFHRDMDRLIQSLQSYLAGASSRA